MTALRTQTFEPSFDHFIQEEVSLISSFNDARIQQMRDYSKQFLDEVFPLKNGSHLSVKSYIVYYQHLLAFMEDGSQTGLCNPQQFVAYSGAKDNPESIVFKNVDGLHVEIIFNINGKRGSQDQAHIDDIQIETIGKNLGEIAFVASNEQQGKGHRWFSMVRGDSSITTTKTGQKICHCPDRIKDFTSKDGGDYQIG